MPAFVKRSVGSSPGTSGEERTRVWPLRSKYCRNFSRSSPPVIGGLIVTPRLSPRPGRRRTRGRPGPPSTRRNRGAGGEVGDHVVGDVRGRAAPPQPRGEIARGPGVPGEEVGGREPRGPRVESSARTARTRYDLLKKELPAGATGARSLVRCSNDCSPVEKMPRTLRSKSSALVAASRAVSYEMTPSR